MKSKLTRKILLYAPKILSPMEMGAANLIQERVKNMSSYITHNLWELPGADLVIFFGTAKWRFSIPHIVKIFLSKFSRRFIVLESPVIGRKAQELTHRDPIFRAGVGGFFADHGFEYAVKLQQDSTAKTLLFGKSDAFPLVDFKGRGAIGIAMQIPGDASIKGVNQVKQILNIIDQVRASQNFANAKIILRTPPLLADYRNPKLDQLKRMQNVEVQIGTNENKEDFFKEIEFLVTFSSTMGIDAIARGIPACGLDKRSFLRLISDSTLDDLLSREIKINPNYLNILSNTTWKVEDLFSSAFNRIVLQLET